MKFKSWNGLRKKKRMHNNISDVKENIKYVFIILFCISSIHIQYRIYADVILTKLLKSSMFKETAKFKYY